MRPGSAQETLRSGSPGLANVLRLRSTVLEGFAGSRVRYWRLTTVRERLQYAIKELHTGHLMVLCQFGSMPPELARQNTNSLPK